MLTATLTELNADALQRVLLDEVMPPQAWLRTSKVPKAQ
jgi:hypothetical protein